MEPTADQPTYVHGTDPAEQDRLGRLNRLLNAPCLAALGLRGSERVLDVGAGLGILSRAMARAAPDVTVVAVDRDEAQRNAGIRLAALEDEPDSVDWRDGDAHHLPLAPEEWGSFDIALARYVIEHSARPSRIIDEMARSVRPGGRVVLIDDDYALLRVHPEVAGLEDAWDAFCRSLERTGLDPWIGRRLPALLTEAGLEVRRADWLFFGGCAGEARFELIGQNFVDLLRGARHHVLEHGAIPADRFDDALGNLENWRAAPGAALWYGACYAEARRPCGAGFTLTP